MLHVTDLKANRNAHMKRILGLLFTTLFLFVSCAKKKENRFRKLSSAATSISFKNELKDTPELNILTYLYYYNGAGVAAADFNNDGLVDLYFTSNQGADKFYINKGDFKFEDVTVKSQINNNGNWTTGVTHVDINNDGLLDIYICKVGNYQGIEGHNLLYINQGIDEEGLPVFKEDAAAYGLAFSGFSTQAAFFDFDLDGDLDMYLMNHSVHPNSNYGYGAKRKEFDVISGDRLYRNDGGIFVDVSAESGIYQGIIGYGLGLSISDINNDGYPDIYVGNDFFENDYLYLNQKDGTFLEIISQDDKKLGHTTHYSMGNSIADLNNDGLMDILSVDMLPEDLETYKTSGLEYPYPTYESYLKNGYAPQYMQNTFHLNLGNGSFSEIANLSGIAATEWSWGVLAADFDNDGFKDIFVSNGILGATNDMDFISFIANDNIQKRISKGLSDEDMPLINEIPEKKVANYFFRNTGDLRFQDVTSEWFQREATFSNGCAYADLDNDGDLDLVVNNINEEALILENISDKDNHFLKLDFNGSPKNRFGIGAKVRAYTSKGIVLQEHFVTKGYLSAVPNTIHLGIGKDSILDSLKVIWPDGTYQTLKNVKADQRLVLYIGDSKGDHYNEQTAVSKDFFTNVNSPINFIHKEQASLEFNRDPLIPFANTNEGPSIAVADINGDGLEDLFITGAKGQPSALFLQNQVGAFTPVQEDLFAKDAMSEDISSVFFDANGNGNLDLLVVSGGNEFKTSEKLWPRLYINQDGIYNKDENQFIGVEVNASKVRAVDFDNDGDLDITISSDQKPWEFGITPKQYLFENDGKGNFQDVTAKHAHAFEYIGNVKDFLWVDLNENGFKDLVVVGHWMPVTVFINNGGKLVLQTTNGLDKTNGWWNVIKAEDIDNDGDIDFIIGNWGENSKLRASENNPIKLYSADFDANGSIEPLVTYFHKGKETPFASKDELVKQIPSLNKKYLSYGDFAMASISDLFSTEKLNNAMKKDAYEFRTCLFENDGNGFFKVKGLPVLAQAATVRDILIEDIDNDGFKDLFLVGNTYEVNTQLGRMDALHGLILYNDKKGDFQWERNQNFDVSGPARMIQKITINGIEHFIVAMNNNAPVFLMKTSNKKI